MRPFGCPLCGLKDRRSILAQVIAWKNLGLSYPLANLEAAVATTRGRGVFIVVRVWIVLSALLGCVEVGGSARSWPCFGLSPRYCGVARAIQTTRLLYWRYYQSSAWYVLSDVEVQSIYRRPRYTFFYEKKITIVEN